MRAYLQKFHEAQDSLKKLFEIAGQTGSPAPADRALYEQWKAFGMDESVLEFAAQIARKAEGSKVAFMNTVLNGWHNENVQTLSDAQAQQEKFRQSAANARPAPSGAKQKVVSAQQYSQRTYNSDDEQDMLLEQLREVVNEHG